MNVYGLGNMGATTMLFQTPFQDIPTQLPNTFPNEDARSQATLMLQRLQFSGTLTSSMPTPEYPARFRVVVIRYIGEMDFRVDNNIATGWDSLSNQGNHMVFPGENWENKPYVRGQIQILFDREYVKQQDVSNGVVVSIDVPIYKKLTYEAVGSGATAVGRGNVFIGISSNSSAWNLFDAWTTGTYKES